MTRSFFAVSTSTHFSVCVCAVVCFSFVSFFHSWLAARWSAMRCHGKYIISFRCFFTEKPFFCCSVSLFFQQIHRRHYMRERWDDADREKEKCVFSLFFMVNALEPSGTPWVCLPKVAHWLSEERHKILCCFNEKFYTANCLTTRFNMLTACALIE